jgi:hypothetical protein
MRQSVSNCQLMALESIPPKDENENYVIKKYRIIDKF